MTVPTRRWPAPASARPAGTAITRRRTAITLAGLSGLGIALVGLAARYSSTGTSWAIATASMSVYLMLLAAPAAILLGFARRWVLTALCAAVLTVDITAQAPLYRPAQARSTPVRLTVLTENLRLGRADPSAVVASVRLHRVDVLMLEELTGPELVRLRHLGLDATLPFSRVLPEGGAAGVGLWSRYPLSDVNEPRQFTFGFISARVGAHAEDAGTTVAVLHLPGPWPQPAGPWSRDIHALPAQLRSLVGPGVPAVVGGDFNATWDVAQFRGLLSGGWHDGAEQAGAGSTRTYPANTWLPPVLAIDHVLTYRAVATSARTVGNPGSDHRGLLVTMR